MSELLTREMLETPGGRRRAWRALMLQDHGVVRLLYDNTHEIAPKKMWRSYQPSPHRLEKWRNKGVKTVINLRGDKPSGHYFLEEEACRVLGLTLVTFRVFSREAPTKSIFHGARKLFETIDYPAVMHCKSGADRAGLMATLYLFFQEGAPLDIAMKQLSWRYGHIRHGKTGVIDFALQKFIDYARSSQSGLASVDDFLHWVDEIYDPAAVNAEFKGAWWGNILTEDILRRE